jgi:hypothetical protein
MFTKAGFQMPGYNAPNMLDNDDPDSAPSSFIPPVVWMFVFLIVGYLLVRGTIE